MCVKLRLQWHFKAWNSNFKSSEIEKYSQYSFLNQKKIKRNRKRWLRLVEMTDIGKETVDSLKDKLNLCNIKRNKRQLFQEKRNRLKEIPNNEPSLLKQPGDARYKNGTSDLNYEDNLRENLQKCMPQSSVSIFVTQVKI